MLLLEFIYYTKELFYLILINKDFLLLLES